MYNKRYLDGSTLGSRRGLLNRLGECVTSRIEKCGWVSIRRPRKVIEPWNRGKLRGEGAKKERKKEEEPERTSRQTNGRGAIAVRGKETLRVTLTQIHRLRKDRLTDRSITHKRLAVNVCGG